MDEQNSLTGGEHAQGMRSFGNYDLMRRIDMGGMGEVYLARQRSAFNREVAVKIIRDDASHDPLARARFFREAEVSSRLKHDHILPLFEFGEVEGRLFLVTPYISGGTLAQRLQAGPLSTDEVYQLFTALVQAVAYIHRRGIVHRDLKPSNILLDYDETSAQVYVRLIDFGIATKQGEAASPPLTPSGHEMGTLAYMAPERLDGIAAPSNDIYSLGVILYQMLTRILPVREAIFFDSLPVPFEVVIRRCMAANPEDRYASATDILQALAGEVGNVPATPQKEGEIFGEADYAAPTINIAYAWTGGDVGSREKQSLAAGGEISIAVPGSKKLVRRGHRRQKPLLAILSLLIVVVLFVMGGLFFLVSPLVASASVKIGPQVHMLQQVYTITAQPSLTSIDVAATSIPAPGKVVVGSSSLTGQTTGQRCNGFFFSGCQQVVAPSDVENLSSQLRQSLISQLSAQMDSQLQAIHATEIGSKQFTDLSEASTPDIGTVSGTVAVTLTEQVSVEYIHNADVQQLARLLLAREAGPNTGLVNSTIRIGQPVIEEITDPGTVTVKVAAAGVEEYHYPSTQLQAILNHIKGMTLADARLYLRQQPGVDANSVSISLHTVFDISSTLPDSTSQIKLISINPTMLPSASLPVLSTPTATIESLTPSM